MHPFLRKLNIRKILKKGRVDKSNHVKTTCTSGTNLADRDLITLMARVNTVRERRGDCVERQS